METVEGNDQPPQLGAPEFASKGNMRARGLFLHMTKPIFYAGQYVIIDSGFCVLKGFMHWEERHLCCLSPSSASFGLNLFQKLTFLNTSRTRMLVVGSIYAISWMLDNVKYNVWCMKELKNVMIIMTTDGALSLEGAMEACSCRFWTDGDWEKSTTFTYNKQFDYHFCFCHAVNNQNNLHHAIPSIEGTWTTHWWPICVFAFLMAVAENNTSSYSTTSSKGQKTPTLFLTCSIFVANWPGSWFTILHMKMWRMWRLLLTSTLLIHW